MNAEKRLCQRPVKELEKMRKNGVVKDFEDGFDIPVPACFELKLCLEKPEEEFELKLREFVSLCYRDGVLMLDITDCGAGRTVRGVRVPKICSLQILSDTSSLEIFVNDGEEVFTTRIYDSMASLHVKLDSERMIGQMECYSL